MDRQLVERAIQGDEDAYAGLMAIAGDRLLAIAYRILRDLHRAEDAVQVALVNAWRDLPSASDATSTVADRDRLDRAFRRLPTDQRAIVVLHHYLGWSQPEIALALEIPVGTVKSRMYHAKRALQASLEADARASSSQERMA